ncbi:MAG: transporter [Zoogloea sp.]|uniref:SphA family protein n=1 Tax=Zoogloea sp. TaxID=49181 RepID=UPI00260FB72F|nr:transporter [Zoogloea sp.]MDD3327969.1 transporter [Zoogloea sp.]
MKKSAIALLVGGLFLAAGAAQAKEGGDQYPNGAENWYAGALPPPGTYFINYFGHYGGKLQDDKGNNALPGGKEARVDATFDALRIVHITNTKILGANWGVHAILPVVNQSINISPLGGRASKFGIGDITINPIVLSWHHSPELHTALALDINLPTGSYDKNDPRTSIGANYYSYEPIYAVTWLPKGGWEVSGKFMYNMKSRNDDTKYQSGDEFHMDYLVGKHVGEWAFGISGYYLKQTTDDKQNGVKVANGNRGQVFAFGPSVKYSAKNGSMFIAQWQHETMVENRFQGDKLWFKMILPL